MSAINDQFLVAEMHIKKYSKWSTEMNGNQTATLGQINPNITQLTNN